MEVFLGIETEADQSIICTGSYYGRERLFEPFVITERESYRMEVMSSTLYMGDGAHKIMSEKDNCVQLTQDFVAAVREGRPPVVTGESVLPAMRVLQEAQDAWDAIHGAQSLPGRELRS
jgi:2-hydroxy-4-carboxymuconate semialdehyde hemiacetal dehydrogenase